MHKVKILALTVGSVLFAANVNAANQVADARGNAMGNTGVASADYLVAPFYNPALGANFKENDDFAVLVPALALSARDADDSLTTIDDLQSVIDDYESSGSADINTLNEINGYLAELDGNALLTVNANLGFAIAFPTNAVSSNLFARGYTEIVAGTEVETDNYLASSVNILAFGYSEVGLSLAKEFLLSGEKVSFGITPKYQQMTTYGQNVSLSDFDLDDYDKSKVTKNAVNFDLGAVWYRDDFHAAVAVKDLLAQKIDVKDNHVSGTYELNTQITLGLAYAYDYFTAAIDADLTKQNRFRNADDDTQFVRFGMEGDAWGWAQLRAGYEIDLQGTLENSITAGIGLSPFNTVNLDIAGSYAGENQLGASANLAFTF